MEGLLWYAEPHIYAPHPNGPAFDDRDLSWHARSVLAKIKGGPDAPLRESRWALPDRVLLGAVRRDAGRCAAMGGDHLTTNRLRTESERASGRNGQHHHSRTFHRSPVVLANLRASMPERDGDPCLRLHGEDDGP